MRASMKVWRVIASIGMSLAAVLLSAPVWAGPAVADESALGLSDAALRAAFADLQAPRRPVLGPDGIRAQWLLPAAPWFGRSFSAAFFLRGNRVVRVERRWHSVEALCQQQSAYADLLTGLSAKYGPALSSNDSAHDDRQRSAAWAPPGFLVLAYFRASAGQCSARVVYELSDVRDASEL